MGRYVNPGNQAFKRIAGSKYVDKTNLISLMNEKVGGDKYLVCVSRPRRFGKTYAANMLTAYYDCSCDSHALFDHRKIACDASYEAHINKYNVICLDVSGFVSEAKSTRRPLIEVPEMIIDALREDLRLVFPDLPHRKTVNDELLACVDLPEGKPFIFIIDEWDSVIREAKDDEEAQSAYLNLLRGFFKDTTFTPKVIAAAYMTGILPIKKDGTQTAISEFEEYSMLKPDGFAEYVGFTEDEVRALCKDGKVDFEEIKAWYDGYELAEVGSIYNPYSVMEALKTGKCQSYWKRTSAAESLKNYITTHR